MANGKCTEVLSSNMDGIIKAFKSNLQEISNRIISCFYTCFKDLFIKWAEVYYDKYPIDFIKFISDTAFTDSIFTFKEKALNKQLYSSNANVKTVLFSFYKMKMQEYLQREKRLLHKQRQLQNMPTDTEPSAENCFLVLEKALKKMEPMDRQIIVWRHLEEKPNAEIAKLLGITVPAATNRIYRCMNRLKELIQTNN